MTWQEQGGISEIFWTFDKQFAFQRAGNMWNLYEGEMGVFVRDFRSFVSVQEYIRNERMKGENNDD